jgi:hypothetical protein
MAVGEKEGKANLFMIIDLIFLTNLYVLPGNKKTGICQLQNLCIPDAFSLTKPRLIFDLKMGEES